MEIDEPEQVIGFNTEAGPMCLKCYSKGPQKGPAIMEGKHGGWCAFCNTKLNHIANQLIKSVLIAFNKE